MADDKPQNADFIGRVVSDAKNPPETRMLTGWFGDSSEEGHRRLYSDAELHCFADIPDDAILYSEPVRDSQPAGCVMVWIKRDADVKQGGSAASRAARFLQGQVQQDFASGAAGSLDKAGLRCVTQVPCGEPTGFTGQCTKQPDVGGAWPCITAIPHCYEVTGFTGKCTNAPWPNPTRYIGCTILHCPTHDLTHIPHICNIVASGQPGCVVVNPPEGGDPAQKAAAAEVDEKETPATSIPGCGYTKSWGVCETHLLGCGAAAKDDAAYITSICAPTAFCHVSQNCGGSPAAEAWTSFCTRAHPPVCYPTEACHTQAPQCGAANFAAAPGGAAAQPASAICATAIGCDITFLCHTRVVPLCFPTPICPTLPQQCFPIPSPFCPVTQGCPFGAGGGGDPAQRFAAFGAAAPVAPNSHSPNDCPSALCHRAVPAPLTQVGCPPSDFVACSLYGGCPTLPKGDCTFFNCPSLPQYAAAGPGGGCTQSGPQCPTHAKPQCTFFGPACPPTPATICTQFAPCPTLHTQAILQCNPSAVDACPTRIGCQPGGGQQFARAFDQSTEFCPTSGGCGDAQAQAVIGGFTHPTPATHCFVCPPFDFAAAQAVGPLHPTGFPCPPSSIGICTLQVLQCQPQFGYATSFAAACDRYTATPNCTNIGPQCPTLPPATRHVACPSVAVVCQTQFCERKATGIYCEYVTQQAGCTHFPCNPYTMVWVCNYPN